MIILIQSQVENYGPVPAEKHRKSLQRESSIPTGNFSDDSGRFLWESTGNWLESIGKIQEISDRNPASTSGYFWCFPAGFSGHNLQLGKIQATSNYLVMW
jgi:hypothetical protein